ncbi:unnamed protein product [Vitrella brassicaformis CCMP3155]|uniref:CCHC-type domain-containing protein n=1 Tax=Vitrella brassicaformis (strain CCMP3155) TaxID=1169540 RepID=A0A0G4EV61_VITBC|nr:unnamed protein product [Vitrella brassicaformis CCMP3155]|eukprot:CEM01944.1 unnamed protein product [Vitrella brassicaformis CCMP3155]
MEAFDDDGVSLESGDFVHAFSDDDAADSESFVGDLGDLVGSEASFRVSDDEEGHASEGEDDDGGIGDGDDEVEEDEPMEDEPMVREGTRRRRRCSNCDGVDHDCRNCPEVCRMCGDEMCERGRHCPHFRARPRPNQQRHDGGVNQQSDGDEAEEQEGTAARQGTRRRRRCSNCGAEGHDCRNCPHACRQCREETCPRGRRCPSYSEYAVHRQANRQSGRERRRAAPSVDARVSSELATYAFASGCCHNCGRAPVEGHHIPMSLWTVQRESLSFANRDRRSLRGFIGKFGSGREIDVPEFVLCDECVRHLSKDKTDGLLAHVSCKHWSVT